MAREDYRAQLDALRDGVVALGELVVERLADALEALETEDEALAREVIEGDDEINQMYLDLEGDCIDLFALQQPVAGDLRFVAASFKVLTDLERVGDLATNLAGYALEKRRDRVPDPNVQDIGALAVEMVEDAVAAYRAGDVEAARAVAERDDELDGLCGRAGELVIRDLVRTTGNVEDDLPTAVTRLLLTVRDLERVGDHAVNVAARVTYMEESDYTLVY